MLPLTRRAAEQAGRPTPALAAWMMACALPDRAEARMLAGAQIALYASQPGFAGFFEHTPWVDEAARIHEWAADLTSRVPWADLGRDLVPDAMLDGLAAAGDPDEVAVRVAAKEH